MTGRILNRKKLYRSKGACHLWIPWVDIQGEINFQEAEHPRSIADRAVGFDTTLAKLQDDKSGATSSPP